MPDTAKIQGIEFSIKGGVSKTSTEAVERLSRALKDLRAVTGRGLNTGDLARQINDFAAAMKALKDASKIKISDDLGNNISTLAGAMKGINSGQISLLKQMGTAMQAFNKTGKISIQEGFEQRIVKIADAAGGLSDTAIAKLSQMASALSKLQGVKLTGFSGAVNKAKKEGDKAKRDAEKAKREADKNKKESAKQQEKQQTATGQTGGKQKEERKTSPFGKLMLERWESLSKLDLLQTKLAKLRVDFAKKIQLGKLDDQGVISAVERIQNLKKQIEDMQTATNIGAQFKSMFQMPETSSFNQKWGWDLKQNLSAVGTLLSSHVHPAVKLVASVLKSVVGTVWNIAKGIARWAFNTAVSALKKVFSLMKSIAKKAVEIAKKIPAAFGKLTGISNLTKTFENLLKPLKNMGRIAMYRAARSAIKFVTDALQQGAERAYFYAKQFGNATKYIADALDGLSSKNFKMQNQLGGAFATMLASVQPILIQLINLVTRAAQVVTQFFAVMSGSGTYLKAKDYTKAWADDTAKGAKAAKEWKNQLMGFDEINRLEEPSDSGGGNSDLYKDYENMFEEVAVESKFADFFKQIRDMLKSGEWGRLGKLLGEKFNSWINSFNWNKWGEKIGTYLQKGIDLAYNFLDTKNVGGESMFRNLGAKIAGGLDSLADQIDFKRLGRLATKIRTALWDILYGAFTNPGSMAKLATNLSDFVLGALEELADWLDSLDPIAVAKAIRDFFGNIKGEEIKNAFVRVVSTAWTKAMALKDELFPNGMLATVAGHISAWIESVDWTSVGQTIVTNFSNAWEYLTTQFDKIWPEDKRAEFVDLMKDALKNIVIKALDLMWDGLSGLHNVFNYKLGQLLFPDSFNDWYWSQGEYAGKDIVMGMIEGAKEKEGGASAAFGDVGEASANGFGTKFLESWGVNQQDIADALQESGKSAVSVFAENLLGGQTEVETNLDSAIVAPTDEAAKKVPELVREAGEKVRSLVDTMKKTLSSSTFTKIGQDMVSGLKNGFGSMWDSFAGSVKTVMQSLVTEVKTAVQGAFSSMSASISTAVSSARTTISNFASDARTTIGNIISDSRSTLNNLINQVRSTVSGIMSKVRVRGYATGGFPEDGLFYANHNEMVGRFTNGRTAVANNDMIVTGIEQGVFRAVTAAMNARSGGDDDREINVYIGNEKIYSGFTKWNRQQQLIAGGRA